MNYERPARTFCDQYHRLSNWYLGPNPYGEPESKTTARVLKVLTSLSSICVRRRDDIIATAAYFDGAANGRAVILCAGNGDVPEETRTFLVGFMVCLHDWYHHRQLADPTERDAAVFELASKIFSFQAERWMLRLHDNPEDRATFDARVAGVRAAIGTEGAAGMDALIDALGSIRNQAQGLFSECGLRDELVGSTVRSLLNLQQLLASGESRAALEVADKSMYHSSQIKQMLDPLQHLVIDDVDNLEDACGNLTSGFSLIRYFVNVTAVVRYAGHFVDFAAKDRMLFRAVDQRFDFCEMQHVLNERGEIVWGECPSASDDRTHVGMRILQVLCEQMEPGNAKLIPAIGSSAPLCSACYNALTGLYRVPDLPSALQTRLFCSGSVRDGFE